MSLRTTEKLHAKASGLDARDGKDILSLLLEGQQSALVAVKDAIPSIEAGANLMARTLQAGGNIYYVAAGSSGLMGMADGLELPGTFGIPKENIFIKLAGGQASLTDLAGSVEDDADAALNDAADLGKGDCVICISASGSTPYPLAFLDVARKIGAATISITNTPDSELLNKADVAIYLATPAEVIAGSTRMGAGTAQKVALNMISTLAGIRLGHVHDGHMVNLYADNKKLVERATRIVSDIAGCSVDEVATHLANANGAVKPAVLLAFGVKDLATAQRILESADQNLRTALSKFGSGDGPVRNCD